MTDSARTEAVDRALAALDLDAKASLLGGQDEWSLPALPQIGLQSLVMSDGPIGVRGIRWTPEDPSIALPSSTSLAASWDPELARRAGHLLAQEARRKGVHVVLGPTVNLHRSPLGGRHFEGFSEDPLLTGVIGVGYVRGLQEGAVATTAKHFVANEAETQRFTVNNIVDPRTLREMYFAPFEAIVKQAQPWGLMSAYNCVNGLTMTHHDYHQNVVLRDEWGFDGYMVSDWMAARDTVGTITGGTDVAMPGPDTVFGPPLAQAVREGRVAESVVDDAVRRVLMLAARVGILDDAPAAVTHLPAAIDGDALAREVASRGFVLLKNDNHVLPLAEVGTQQVALIGSAARDARILGGGAAQVFPVHVVSPLQGLEAAFGGNQSRLTYAMGASLADDLEVAGDGFDLRVIVSDAAGAVLADAAMTNGEVQWAGADMPEGATYESLHTVELSGTFTPRESGAHVFGTKAIGGLRLAVDGDVLFDGERTAADTGDPLEAYFAAPEPCGTLDLTAGRPIEVSLRHVVPKPEGARAHNQAVVFSLMHQPPARDAETMLEEAVAAAEASDVAVVVVATTERVESEGSDRADLRLPGGQDELVARVAAANPNTVVLVNTGSPVEMPWRDDVAAIMLTWFPGQEAGGAIADVLLGMAEPGGRLPTTWPIRLEDAPVTQVIPTDGTLVYDEGLFIGYRGWDRTGIEPAYPFGHGLGYTTWTYEALTVSAGDQGASATVTVRNRGRRRGREVVQVYVAPDDDATTLKGPFERPLRWLAGFASVEAEPGESLQVTIDLPDRTFQCWDEDAYRWSTVPGTYLVQAGRSITATEATAQVTISAQTGP